MPEKIVEMIESFQVGMRPQSNRLIPIACYTALIWTLETLWIYFLVMAFGSAPTFVEIVFLTMIPLLASAFPFTPSGTGVVELTLFSCLRVVGIASPVAASITVVNRFIDYWLHIGLGLVVIFFSGIVQYMIWIFLLISSVLTCAVPQSCVPLRILMHLFWTPCRTQSYVGLNRRLFQVHKRHVDWYYVLIGLLEYLYH